MVNEVIKKFEEKGIEYTLTKPGEDKPDIMTKDFDIGVETGLKNGINLLEQKLIVLKKNTYVLVPNEVVLTRYWRIISNSLAVIIQLKDIS